MAEPTTVAGVTIAACGVLASAVAYLFRSWGEERERWNTERKEMLGRIEAVQAARVADAQRAPAELLQLARDSQRILTENTASNGALARSLDSLRGGIEDLPEEVVRSIRARNGK